MADESTTTIKFDDYAAPWSVAKGTVSERKAALIQEFGLVSFEDKTLAEVTVAANAIATSLWRASLKAIKEGYRPQTSISPPKAPEPTPGEPEEQVGEFGLGAFIKTANTADELTDLYNKNKEIWTDELTQLAKERKKELGIE